MRRSLPTTLGSSALLVAVFLSFVTVTSATAPNPGHNFVEIGGGVVQGDVLYGSAADTISALAKNATATRYLSNTGASNNPAWAQVELSNGITGRWALNVQTFTSTGSNTWNRPSTGSYARIQIWGAGGSGGRAGDAEAGGGGGGGGYNEITVALSALDSTETCSVGTGGAAVTSDNVSGSAGGNTTFADSGELIAGVFTAYGGGGGSGTGTSNSGGGGGGPSGAGGTAASLNAGAGDGGADNSEIDAFGGGGSDNAGPTGGHSFFGGGGGGFGGSVGGVGTTPFPGGGSFYGGGGGGGAGGTVAPSAAGYSLYGGNGGAGATGTDVGGDGVQPGGGGGGSESGNSGAGGNGKCVITVW